MTPRIAVDWGTSALRLWALDAQGAQIAQRRSDQGMGRLAPEQFEQVFLDLAGDLIGGGETRVLVCGMAGARGGWCEAPYRPVPADLGAPDATRVACRDPRLDVRILGGLCQSDPADVMRGEETQIAGFLSKEPDFDGTLCLPGTHTKWVRVAGGMVHGFRTVMTGEIFALLAAHSVLRASVATDAPLCDAAFREAVRETFNQPARLTADLFSLRAQSLLHGQPPEAARSRLSAMLIGQELAATQSDWQDRDLIIVGDDRLAALYAKALETLGKHAQTRSGSSLSLAGICAAFDSVFDTKD